MLRFLRARPLGAAVIVILAFYCLTGSGRLASSDAGPQLQAATALVTTGSPSLEQQPPPNLSDPWLKAPNGRYYENHDVGNVLLLAPAAAAGAAVSSASPAADVQDPPRAARVAASLTMSLLGACGSIAFFLCARRRYDDQLALLVALGLPITTFYWVYARANWDVEGAAALCAVAMYFAYRALVGERPSLSLALAAVAVGGAGLFRYTALPFMALAVAGVWLTMRGGGRLRNGIVAAAAGLAAIAPQLIYNHVRTGSSLSPANNAPQFVSGSGAGGNPLVQFLALFAFPNKGLFVFAPILILFCGLPWIWRQLELAWRTLIAAFGIAAVLYCGAIATRSNWGGFGWGPRLLVPMLPVFFVGSWLVFERLWSARRRVAIGLASLSSILTLAPVVVNWNVVSDDAKGITDPNTPWPRQMYAVFDGFLRAARGQPLDERPSPGGGRPVFPDFWWVQGLHESTAGALAAAVFALALLSILFIALRAVTSPDS